MALFNTAHGYGSLAKTFHWMIAGLFALQYVGGLVMLRTPAEDTTIGLSQATWFNWHKSLGLVVLLVTVLRLWNRRVGELPSWAVTLTPLEQGMIHRTEQLLYAAMLLMPLSGFVYCMAGGYGVLLFGVVALPNLLGTSAALATLARWTHVVASIGLLLPLGLHVGLVLGHQHIVKDGLIRRMLPGRRLP